MGKRFFLFQEEFLCMLSSHLLRGQEGNPSLPAEYGQIFQICHRQMTLVPSPAQE